MQRVIVLFPAVAAAGFLATAAVPSVCLSQETGPPIVINEVLADPPADLAGDANGDGVRDTYQDEFIELVNRSGVPTDISGWRLGPAGADPFVFPPDTRLAPGEYVVLFGGGSPAGLPGRGFVDDGRIGSGLSNAAGRLLLIDPAGPDTLQDITYAGWDTDASWVRDPEGWGEFSEHGVRYGALFSPAAPSTPLGGPGSGRPMVYRTRVVNLTSAGFGVAWRSSEQADGRLERWQDGAICRTWDPAPAGRLHLVEHYGLGAGTPVAWRVVSDATPAPADSFAVTTTGGIVTTVPGTVFGRLERDGGGEAVSGAQVFLTLRSGGAESGWLAARSDSAGYWSLNLGNLRTSGGAAFPWSAGDTLRVEADGDSAGVAAATVTVTGDLPQEIVLGPLRTDPPPVFEWVSFPAVASVDSALHLGYALADSSQAWATLSLQEEGGTRSMPALTDPAVLDRSDGGAVTVDLSDLPEGSRWWIVARVEDGLNPPQSVISPAAVRIAHGTDRILALPAGVTLITPTLADPDRETAAGLLAGLTAAGEVARWDQVTAAWRSVVRLPDGSCTGEDFALRPGEGYAVVSPVPGTLAWHGPRRYAPPLLTAGAGLALVGISDSTRVRSAAEVLADPAVGSVSRWDPYRQAWTGCFRPPGGGSVGEDFPIGWGEAVAVEVDSVIGWQPAAGRAAVAGPVPSPAAARAGTAPAVFSPALHVWAAGPGTVELLWSDGGGGVLAVVREPGSLLWNTSLSGGPEWCGHRFTGLEPGRYSVTLHRSVAAGELRWCRTIEVGAPELPQPPRWTWGEAPHPERPILLISTGGTVRAQPANEGWYADVAPLFETGDPADEAVELIELAPDGGWYSFPLTFEPGGGYRSAAVPAGPVLAMSGLEVSARGPLRVEVRWQVLEAGGPVRGELFTGYTAPDGGGGPPGDGRRWLAAGVAVDYSPGDPPVMVRSLDLVPGPEGQAVPEALAVRITSPGRAAHWLGPVALAVPERAREPALLPAVPNPFNPETRLRYRVPAGGAGRVRLEIRDVRGRQVRLLVDADRSGGDYEVRWDGTDGAGHRVAAGVYLVILEIDRSRVVRKIMLLK